MTASIWTHEIPAQANVFEYSSFFCRHPDVLLPTLSDVKAECAKQNSPALSEAMRPPPVMYESLGLVVKFGRMDQVHPYLPRLFLVSLIKLISLARIDGSALYDVEVNGNRDKRPWTGPFDSVKALHDWFANTSKMGFEAIWPGRTLEEIPDGFRHLFPDDSKVVFTHGDLHPTNIMVNPVSPEQIVAIIDWEQSGWWPDYWEFCKAECTVGYKSEWRAHLLRRFEEPEAWDAFGAFTASIGH
ncbi:hypothetical protein BN1723_010163 [Verticillium longisporum]|uniref:Aminoglycoside phosphotransferase domain-containing protein n=1 Tax=Verticillium longisporum TaxID=100787 RepID=A0A0G4KVT0_VERLO|nr:hypothetical protein BN1723_010163 [Verticillium longisporum]